MARSIVKIRNNLQEILKEIDALSLRIRIISLQRDQYRSHLTNLEIQQLTWGQKEFAKVFLQDAFAAEERRAGLEALEKAVSASKETVERASNPREPLIALAEECRDHTKNFRGRQAIAE